MSKGKRSKQKARMPTPQSGLSPRKMAVARKALQVFNTGYSESGASHTKGSMMGWNPLSSSPNSDINANRPELVSRSCSLYMGGNPLATSGINTARTNIIGAGLKLKPKIDAEVLGLSKKEAARKGREIKRKFALWANSKLCDIARRNNFYDMQDILFVGCLLKGDSWAAVKWRKPRPGMRFALRLQLFEADRVSNPDSYEVAGIAPGNVVTHNQKNGNRIVNGVEIDSDGAAVAYWICNRYPYDPTNLHEVPQWTRVLADEPATGLPNIIQLCNDERPDQYRGVPYLAPVIEQLKQVGRYTDAELMAAIIKAFFTIFFEETTPGHDDDPVGEVLNGHKKVSLDPNDFELGQGTMNALPYGYRVNTVDGSRTLSTFEPFMNSLFTQIGAALEQPKEVITKAFNSSYTASRAAMLQAWAAFKMRREWFNRDFNQPIYEIWMTEQVATGYIEAEGFFEDELKRQAWCAAEWYGPVMGVLDPVKEAEGAGMRIALGLSTREKEAAEMTGTDFDTNIQQLAMEQEDMQNAGIPIVLTAKGGENNENKKNNNTQSDSDGDDEHSQER